MKIIFGKSIEVPVSKTFFKNHSATIFLERRPREECYQINKKTYTKLIEIESSMSNGTWDIK